MNTIYDSLTEFGQSIIFAFSNPGTAEIFLTLAFIFTTVVLLSLCIRSAWPWVVKSAAIILASAFYILVYFSIIGMQGWPTTALIPNDVEVIWAHVETPNKSIKKPGYIAMWVIDKADKTIGKKPRAHILPYDKDLHKKIQDAKNQIAQGKRVGMKSELNGKGKSGQSMRPGQGRPGNNRPPDSVEQMDRMMYRLPPPEVPKK